MELFVRKCEVDKFELFIYVYMGAKTLMNVTYLGLYASYSCHLLE